MDSYVYEPIDLANASFRLVRLYQDDVGPIRCELFHAQIHNAEDAIEYEALSYTWGGTIKTHSIELNGKNMPVTESLFQALQHLRYKHEDRIFWIDAICIDQQNIRERGHQVQQMASIYESARQVIIWLGLATPDTDVVFCSMRLLEQHAINHPCNKWPPSDSRWRFLWSTVELLQKEDSAYCRSRQCSGFSDLLSRTWFRRIWVLQEVAKARSAKVVCGNESVSARIFAVTPSLLDIKLTFHCQAILDIMPGPSRKYSWWVENRGLYFLLSKFRESEASDPRDLIYALLGISSDACATELLKPDYGKSLEAVIRDALVFLFDTYTSEWSMRELPQWTSIEAFRQNLGRLLLISRSPVLRSHPDIKSPFKITGGRKPISLLEELRTMGETASRSTDADGKDEDGRTPLACAARDGKSSLVEELLYSSRVDVNSQDWLGQTPLSMAAEAGRVTIVLMLVSHSRINVNLRDWRGRTPLSWAAGRGHYPVVEILLRPGMVDDINSMDKSGCTALSLATENSHFKVMEALIAHGAVIRSSCE